MERLECSKLQLRMFEAPARSWADQHTKNQEGSKGQRDS